MKILTINCSTISEEQLLILEDKILEASSSDQGSSFEEYSIDIDIENKKISVAKNSGNANSFQDYLNPGKFLKNLLVSNIGLSDEEAKKTFGLSEIELKNITNTGLHLSEDKHLYVVPPDDPKLTEALGKLEKIQKVKTFKKSGLM